MNNPSSMQYVKEIQSLYFRDNAIEYFDCRHCYQSVKTSNSELCAAQLCEDCFTNREKYRKKDPFGKQAERNMLGDQYGKNRAYISYVCAGCSNVFEIVPNDKELNYPSAEEQKRHYEMTLPFHNGVKPFKAIVLEYKYAPKGWGNKILCKSCYDTFLEKRDLEITELRNQKKEEEIISRKTATNETLKIENIDTDEKQIGLLSKIVMFVVGIAIVANLFAFIKTLFTEGYAVAGDKVPAGGVISFIAVGVGWFLLGPYLEDKGYKDAGKLVKWSLILVFCLFLASVFLSKCDSGTHDIFEFRPPRSL